MKKLIAFLFLGGCMVGPKYQAPDVALPDQFIESTDASLTDSDLVHWWEQFDDPLLDELIAETCSSNFDVRLAFEQVMEARMQFSAEAAKLFPQLSLDAAAVRTRQSLNIFRNSSTAEGEADLSPIQNFFQIGFDAIWELDFFGKFRHAKKAAFYTWEAMEESARDILITMISEVVNNYVAIRTLQRLLELSMLRIELDQEELFLEQVRVEAGLSSDIPYLVARRQLDEDQATKAELEASLQQSIYRLAVLTGKTPESMVSSFDFPSSIPIAHHKIPPGLPSDLLRRRPDIRSAERQIAAATEQIGIAVADLFPRIYLTATNLFAANPSGSNYGYGSSELSTLFKQHSLTWSLGPGFSWPFLDFGRRRAIVRAQKSIQQQTLIAYEKTVFSALEEVESALTSYFKQEERFEWASDQAQTTTETFELTSDRYESGIEDYRSVLTAKKAWLSAEENLAENSQALTHQFIAIYKALGGDWE